MDGNVSIDERIEGLRWTTEALLDASDLPESLGALLDARERHIRALCSAARQGGLTLPQLLKLKSLIETGGRAHKSLALRKELLKEQVGELQASKRRQACFTPANDTGRRLNIEA